MPKRELSDFQRVVGALPEWKIEPKKAALLVVDMHYYQVHRDFGYGLKAREAGMNHVIDYYYGRVEREVTPRLQDVIPRFREAGAQVIYVRVVSEREDGSDFCLRYRSWGMKVPAGSRDADILDEIAPCPGDIVLNKTTQNVFLSTNLDLILRNLGLEQVVVVGVVTNNCVEAAARTAADYSYQTFVLEDCCAAFSEKSHEDTLKALHRNFAIVMTSDELGF